jgi:transcriptional regulator with XRE-family HTH domain
MDVKMAANEVIVFSTVSATVHVMLTGESPVAIGRRIKCTRVWKGWTGPYTAGLLGTSRQNLANWEAGRGGFFPPTKYVLKFCAVAGVTPNWILRGDLSDLKEPMLGLAIKAMAEEQMPNLGPAIKASRGGGGGTA